MGSFHYLLDGNLANGVDPMRWREGALCSGIHAILAVNNTIFLKIPGRVRSEECYCYQMLT